MEFDVQQTTGPRRPAAAMEAWNEVNVPVGFFFSSCSSCASWFAALAFPAPASARAESTASVPSKPFGRTAFSIHYSLFTIYDSLFTIRRLPAATEIAGHHPYVVGVQPSD